MFVDDDEATTMAAIGFWLDCLDGFVSDRTARELETYLQIKGKIALMLG